jgi:hypothetical protein
MAEKRESDEFEEDDADEAVESDDPDLEHLIKDLEQQKRKGSAPKGGEPAWRRLEKYMEQKRTAELLSDFDDYELGTDDDEAESGALDDDGGPTDDDGDDEVAEDDATPPARRPRR